VPRNPSRQLAVGRSPKPLGRAAGWIFGHWERCGSGPCGTRRRSEMWGSARRVKHRAPVRFYSIAGSHGECAVRPYGRCTVRRVGRGGREVRSSGHQMAVVTQIGSGWTWPTDERMHRWMAADRKGGSCGATRPALSTELSRRSGGFPPSCRWLAPFPERCHRVWAGGSSTSCWS
jgi:hypothetical protein